MSRDPDRSEGGFFSAGDGDGFRPARPRRLSVERIVLAKGALATLERRRFVEAVCALYPEAERLELLDVPHNRVRYSEPLTSAARHARGKRSLVFGAHDSAVRFSEEDGNTCPNYWHFSPTGYCFFACSYCYLAGTPGVWHSPSIKIFLNTDEIARQIDAVARRLRAETAFYVGKLQDALALDPLTGHANRFVPFFGRHPFARQVMLTKTDEVDGLLGLAHEGHTILSWSLNPQRVIDRFEENTPSLAARIGAMKRCAARGYPVRAVVMPLVPIPEWKEEYESFIRRLLCEVPLRRLTLGGICSYAKARWLMEERIGSGNDISMHLGGGEASGDGRARYSPALRLSMYSAIIDTARSVRPECEIALCLEEPSLWRLLHLENQLGKCNCVL